MPMKWPFIRKFTGPGTRTDSRSGIRARIVAIEVRVGREDERAVLITVVFRSKRRVQVAQAELQIVVAALAR